MTAHPVQQIERRAGFTVLANLPRPAARIARDNQGRIWVQLINDPPNTWRLIVGTP